ncbi:MAG: hypothetical protein ACR2QX_06550 [Woeseiaceae bacterium]
MTILALWLPILVSAVFVFLVSAVIWMAMPWHKSDFSKTSDEEGVRSALRGHAPGFYLLPYCIDPKELKDPEVQKKFVEGPQAYITVLPNGVPQMGPKMAMSFIYYVFVGIICAYILSRTVGPDASYLTVFRITGTAAFIAYGIAYIQDSIWFGRPWSITAKSLFDALIYALLTGGAFGWLAT